MHLAKLLFFIAFFIFVQSSCVFYSIISQHNNNVNYVKLKSKELEGEWKLAHIKTADTFYTPEKEIIINFVRWGYSVLNEVPGELLIYIGTDTFKYLSYNYLPAIALDLNRLFFYRLENPTIPEVPHLPDVLTKSLVAYDQKQPNNKTKYVCEFNNNTLTLTLNDEVVITLIRKD